MRAVDTNILVYAEVVSSARHRRARQILEELCEGDLPWALPWPCVYEFLRVVTHPRVYHPPVPLEVALADLRAILASPSLVLLSEPPAMPASWSRWSARPQLRATWSTMPISPRFASSTASVS